MSMTGGVSFFDRNLALKKDGAEATASSASDNADLVLGTNKYFSWRSDGSDDSTTETLTITLSEAIAISRIFLVNHNFKNFQIQYGDPASDFTNVTGLDSYSGNSISVTNFERDTAYFEFDEVTTDKFIVTIDTTQTVDAEKFLNEFIATNELGTLDRYPQVPSVTLDRQFRKENAVSGRAHIEKGFENFSCSMTLTSYPVQEDIDLLDSLHNRNFPFLIWLNGGKPDQFNYQQRGWRLRDVYQVQTDQGMRNIYPQTQYVRGVDQRYSFAEVV